MIFLLPIGWPFMKLKAGLNGQVVETRAMADRCVFWEKQNVSTKYGEGSKRDTVQDLLLLRRIGRR